MSKVYVVETMKPIGDSCHKVHANILEVIPGDKNRNIPSFATFYNNGGVVCRYNMEHVIYIRETYEND